MSRIITLGSVGSDKLDTAAWDAHCMASIGRKVKVGRWPGDKLSRREMATLGFAVASGNMTSDFWRLA